MNKSNFVDSLFTNEEIEEIDRWEEEKYRKNKSNFSDYKKIVRINDATKLLENGYLNKHKVETLAAFVGFTSYNTFSIAFKSITGVTTQEYLKRT
jgi:AraC-like DNA-binding protein